MVYSYVEIIYAMTLIFIPPAPAARELIADERLAGTYIFHILNSYSLFIP